MKLVDYPIIYDAKSYPPSKVLYWGAKNICISTEFKEDEIFDGDFKSFIERSFFLDEDKNNALSMLEEIKEQYKIYDDWSKSMCLSDAKVKFETEYFMRGEDDLFDCFLTSKLNISLRYNDGIKSLLRKAVTINNITCDVTMYAFSDIPFLIIYKGNYAKQLEYSIINIPVFENFYKIISEINFNHVLKKAIESRIDAISVSPYVEGGCIETGELAYVYVDGKFVEHDKKIHSEDEPKFKKL